MSTSHCRVTFQPTGRAVSVLSGTTILEAAARAGLVIDTPCGGAGTCGKCRVRITQGVSDPGEADRTVFNEQELENGWRLACRSPVLKNMVLEVPPSSLFGGGHQIVDSGTDNGPGTLDPAVRKIHVELPAPTLEDDIPDLLRLERAIGSFSVDLDRLRRVPKQLRAQAFQGTAVLSDHRLVDFEKGDTQARCFGVACDIGTTTMVASLLDLCNGQELGVVSRMNPQVVFGDDVVSRIHHAASCRHCLDELRNAVITEVAEMIKTLCADAGVQSRHVYEAVFAGNTTMQHLLCGVDPTPLGELPFAPAYGRGLLLSSKDVGVPINPRGMVYVFPVIGGFVGGDTIAGMLVSEMDACSGPTLMVDVGTNGEIVLANGEELLAASAAAGPAFEGARISCGMRATRGAIEKVLLNDDVHLGVIGDTAPIGVCGSGIIDLVAGLLDRGIVSPEGRLLPPDELPDDLAPALAARVFLDKKGDTAFMLAQGEGMNQRTLALTQRDIREVQLGCGAIRAAINILLQKAGLDASDLSTVLIAGGFGSFIRRDKAQRLGLIPPGVDHRRIHYVGNASLAGARWALLSVEARRRAEELARRTHHVELSIDCDFQMAFAEAMIFPEGS
ncbi:MAG: DUF4445 domain-containing protein [Lentisphaeria bacterium]|nr:DUF4445 domain-containing protein [Lentisphaeria bacterium]